MLCSNVIFPNETKKKQQNKKQKTKTKHSETRKKQKQQNRTKNRLEGHLLHFGLKYDTLTKADDRDDGK